MKELAESEVERVTVGEGGVITPTVDTSSFNNPFTNNKAITAWEHRAMSLLMGSRPGKHRGGHVGERTVQRRRARNKVAKQARKANR